MASLLQALDWIWNVKFIKGHRTEVAKVLLKSVAISMAYQGAATSQDLIKVGIDLPNLSAQTLMVLGALSTYFGLKLEQFAKEH